VSELTEVAAALTADLIAGGSQAADPVISPDGRWVAWTASRVGERERPVSELWLAHIGESAVPARLTDGSVPARLPRWSLDSAWLFYVAGEELRRLRIAADGSAGVAEPVLRWRGEISGVVPLAGGQRVAVVAGDERTEDDERRQAEGDDAMAWSERAVRQHWLWHRLRLLDLASGELTVVPGLAGRHVTSIAQRPDGGPLAVVSWDCPQDEPGAFTSRLHIADPDTGTAADLGRLGFEARSPVWWQGTGGWHVAWLAAVPPADATAVLDVAVPVDGTAASEPVDLTAEMTACPDELVQVAGGLPAALFAEGLDTALYRLDPAGSSFVRVAGWAGQAAGLTASDDATVIAVLTSTAYAPRDVHAGSPGALTQISDTRPELRGVAWGTQEVGVGELGRAEAVLGGSFGWEGPGPHRHDQLSPISYAADVTTPVLILHGAGDTNVPVGQAMYFHRALTQFGAEHELVIYPRENHGFTERAHQIDVLERVRSWFTHWLGDPSRKSSM
jgi:dipeptidyl aminopeptidase/acylaminoacyl peptidase